MKTNFRFVLLGIVMIVCITSLFAQTATRDIVYLKNGSVIHGMIIETIPNVSIKIQTSDGNIFVYNFSDIEKYGKETVPGTESSNSSTVPEGPAVSTSSSFSIFGGASLPIGDFASTNSSEGISSAKTGFAGGVQFVTGGQVGLLVSALYAANSIDASNMSSSSTNTSSYVTSSGNWQSMMVLLGLKIGTANATGANFFVAPLIGVNFGKSPDVTSSATINETEYYYNGIYYYGNIPVSGDMTMQSASATTFAYGGMMEIELGHFIFGARYITCKPHYDITMSGTLTGSGTMYDSYGNGLNITYTAPVNLPFPTDQPTAIIIAYIGISF
jgi:hypothetical protein